MANFWEADPLVSPARKLQPLPGSMPIGTATQGDAVRLPSPAPAAAGGQFWANDPIVGDEGPDPTQLPARDRFEAALDKVRLLQAPDMSPAEFQKMFTEGQDTLIPGVKNPGRFAPYDATDLSQHGMFFGLTDEIEAGMGALGAGVGKFFTGQGPEMGDVWQARLELEQARRDYGKELMGGWGTLAEVAGGLGAGGMAAQGAAAIGKQAPGVWNTTKGLLGAGASGGAYGFGSADGSIEERLPAAGVGSALGAATGVVAPWLVKGASKLLSSPASVAAKKSTNQAIAGAPAAATIKAESKAGFKAAEATGAVVDANALNLLTHDVGKKLTDAGMLLPNGRLVGGFPKVNGALNALRQFTEAGSLSVKQAQTLRRTFTNIAKSADATEAGVGKMLLGQLDDFFEGLPVTAFSANGKAGMDAVELWAQARKDWGRYKRTDAIETAIRHAKYDRAGFSEGLRSQFASILKNERKSQGFSAVELAAMDKYAQGGTLQTFLKDLSSGGTVPAALFGLMSGGTMGAAAGIVGKVGLGKLAKGFVEGGARRSADAVRAGVALPNGLPRIPMRSAPPVIDGSFRRLAVNAANPALEEPRGGLAELLAGYRR
jgi:hypothetical protein